MQCLLYQAIKFEGGSLVETRLLFQAEDADCFQYAPQLFGRVFWFFKRHRNMTLYHEVVNFVRLQFLDNGRQAGRVGHVTLVQKKRLALLMNIMNQVVYGHGVKQQTMALHDVHFITFG